MPANTNNLDGVTVFSSLSLSGNTFATTNATITTLSASSISAPTNLAVGGGTLITRIQKGTISVVAMTVTASRSVSTTATVSGVSTVDAILINPPVASGLSEGVNVYAYVNAANTVTIVLSNTSTANAAQIAGSYPYVAIRS